MRKLCDKDGGENNIKNEVRGGELGVLRVREHPLNMEVHSLTAKSTPSKWEENLMKRHFKQIYNKVMVV